MRLFFVPVLLALFAVVTLADDKDAAADLKAMVGKWDIHKAELGGKDLSALFKTMKFEIAAGGTYTAVLGEEKDNGTFTVDPAKTPRAMDITVGGGPDKGKTMKAIYKLDGDDMTVCYDISGKERPAKFESKPDTTLFLVTYKRKK